ncbi:SagB/ThcOx family dehydrogenase [Engelhardtia mirabilis]|uniref:Nitroreductase family protein n=1 Tax=Engelhardtia mirabilis TaxID=2528011 RepID=A0A518BM45_9BACT|nr:Nitroreductase family protein [Planctomycetes bacterium Pla133]QDV02381.1 Nitroreductase family protein [Planctomycetes bacterium Pla86]
MALWNKWWPRKGRAPQSNSPVAAPADAPVPGPGAELRIVRAYHERTKHHLHRYAEGPAELDWENQPDPFRRFDGSPTVELPLPQEDPGTAYGQALVEGRVAAAPLDQAGISRLLYDSLAISAWKEAGETRWSLRVNPSSGNLHPTEGYLLLPSLGVEGLGESAGVYHYAPREHLLERRAALPADLWEDLGLARGSFLVALSSIHWREAWKYGERAYRYCQHDVGHALAALAVGASGLGWRVRLVQGIGTRDLGRMIGLPDTDEDPGPEAEYPDCLVSVSPDGSEPALPPSVIARFDGLDWHGTPNALSPDHVEWDVIEVTAKAALQPSGAPPCAPWQREVSGRPPVAATGSLRQIVRQRRSALAFDGRTGMSAETFFRIMESCMPRAGRVPFATLPWSPRVHLAVFVHRVDGLTPGLYWLQRDPASQEATRSACREEFLWLPAEGAPEDLPLSLVLPMNLRSQAASISCGQAIAADGAFSLGMIAEFDRSLDEHGAWFYPRLYWEAGAIGQVLYLEAEAVGLRSTGIGCFLDDPMHSILGLKSRSLQSLYHFAVGKPVDDERLTDRPAYPAP